MRFVKRLDYSVFETKHMLIDHGVGGTDWDRLKQTRPQLVKWQLLGGRGTMVVST